jgi:hypothetical protein
MLKLGEEQFNQAKKFLENKARKLDWKLFQYYFESGSAANVLEELKQFQNQDGGFGNGIEPDFRLKASSPMATTIGLQYLRELRIPSDHEMVKGAINYLLSTYDHEKQLWHAVPKEVNEAPHAPWWHYDLEKGYPGFEYWWGNPNAEIVGYLHEHSSLVPSEFLHMVTNLAIEDLKKLPDQMEMHVMLCYQRLADAIPEPLKSEVLEKLRKAVRLVVTLDPDKWSGYSVRPLQAVPSPHSPFYDLLQHEVEVNLDYEIRSQTEEGSWTPNWSWGQYEDAWKQAEQEWKGYLTVKTLKSLHDFGRI